MVGATDQAIRLYECGFSNEASLPTAISGQYPVENGLLGDVAIGTTADALLAAMDHSELLSVCDANGNAVSGKLGTGMTLTLTVNGQAVDRATLVIHGDVNGDGDATTTDARLAILHKLGALSLDTAYRTAADFNGDGDVTTLDAREILLYNLTH